MTSGIFEPGWIRTIDTRLKRAMLYQLSYGPTKLLRRKFTTRLTNYME